MLKSLIRTFTDIVDGEVDGLIFSCVWSSYRNTLRHSLGESGGQQGKSENGQGIDIIKHCWENCNEYYLYL